MALASKDQSVVSMSDRERRQDGAQLMAVQLLLSGYGRDEVAHYLRDTLGAKGFEGVLDSPWATPV